MAIDIPSRMLNAKYKSGRKTCVSPNQQVKLLSQLYNFLERRTDSNFNRVVAKRLIQSKRNRAPLGLARLARHMQDHQDKIAVLVGTVTDDFRLEEIPKMTVCALRVTEAARRRILAAGGEVLTFDQLALRAPKGNNCMLLRGHTKSREAEKHFGRAPGLRGSHTKPYGNCKQSH